MVHHIRLFIFFVCGPLLLSACTNPQVGNNDSDPYKAFNRSVHNFNLALDRSVLRPVAYAYGDTIPLPIRQGVSNFSKNISTSGDIINNVLQFDIDSTAHNTLRFAYNSTIGIFGIFDVASRMNIRPQPTNFGETLAVWGVDDGNYIELPLIGPSTTRASAGIVVDYILSPVRRLNAPTTTYISVAGVGTGLHARYEFGTSIDKVLYKSADSYGQTKSFYLQRQKYKLGNFEKDDAQDVYFDPYAGEISE